MDQDITIGAGQTLFRQGEKGGDLYFIKAGEVELSVRDEETGKEAIVAICGPKSVIGTMSFLEDEPRSASAKVKSEIKCIKICQLQRDRMMKSIPNWFRILVKDLSGNIRRTNKSFIKLNAEIDLLKKKVSARDKQKSKLESDLESARAQIEDVENNAKKKEESLLEEIKSLQKKVVGLQSELANLKKS